jgi:hypothetical protein
VSGASLSVYLMTGTLTGLSGKRILLMSGSKTLIPCSSHIVRDQHAEPRYFAPDEATVIISDYSLGRSETLKEFHSHVLPLSGEKS